MDKVGVAYYATQKNEFEQKCKNVILNVILKSKFQFYVTLNVILKSKIRPFVLIF